MDPSSSKDIHTSMDSDDETEGTNLTSTNNGPDENFDDYDISDDDFIPTVNTNTPVSTVNLKQEIDEPSFSTIDQTLGSLLGIKFDESMLLPEAVPDFGEAEFTTGARGGAVLIYPSKKYPGKTFTFKIYGQSNSMRRYFVCKDCMEIKKLYELKEKVPIVVVKNGRVIEIDPDNPKEEHICLKRDNGEVDEGESSSSLPKIYGPVTFEEGKRSGKILVYESKVHEGHKYKFRCGAPVGKGKIARYYCTNCYKIKHKLGLSNNVPKISVRQSQIIGTDPDAPEDNEHFCVPGTPNFPEAGELMISIEKQEIEDVDRGPANLVDGTRGGQLLAYDSQRFPGHRFIFRKSGPAWKGITSFICDQCNKFKNRFGLTYEIPRTRVKEGRITGDDPDYPSHDHFCHHELPNYPIQAQNAPSEAENVATEDWTQDYGEVKITKGARGGALILYDSLLYPGHQFQFRKSGNYSQTDADRFICVGCMNMTRRYGLSHPIPSICVKNGHIVGRDPDRPNHEHFCVPGSANCPVSNLDHHDTSSTHDDTPAQPVTEFDETKEFGEVKFIKGKMGGHILVYESKKYEGHTFKFRLVPNSASSYVCIMCRKLKLKRGLDYRLPAIKVKEGKIVGYDPDEPPNDHFCLPQCDNYPLKEGEHIDLKGDEEIDRGPAKFIKGNRMGFVLVFESIRYPGIVFRFRKSSGMSTTGATHYACSKCMSIRLKKGLPNVAPYIRVRNGRIVGNHPDYPKNEHFCVNEENALEESMNASQKYFDMDSTEEVKDFGPIKIFNGKQGGQNVVVHSQRFPGHNFKFVKTSNVMSDGSRSYICVLCRKLKRNYGLPNKLPTVRVKSGRFIIYDPEHPLNDHFCHSSCDGYPSSAVQPGGGTEQEHETFDDGNKNFGPVKFVDSARGGKIVIYDSKAYPGHQFRFNIHAGPNMQGARFYKCMKCNRIKNNLGLPNKIPIVKIQNNIIIGRDPDMPGNDHFCIEGTANYPFYGKEDPFKEKPLKIPVQPMKSDFGRAKLRNPNDPNSDITYDSVEFPSYKFEFANVGENNGKGAKFYVCMACREIKREKKLSEKVPYIKVIRGRIVEWNPDQPKVPHFCVDSVLRIPPEYQDPKVVIEPIVEFESYKPIESTTMRIKEELSYFDDDTTTRSLATTFFEPEEKKPRLDGLTRNHTNQHPSATAEIQRGEFLFFEQQSMEISNQSPPEPISISSLDMPVLRTSSLQMTILHSPASTSSNGNKRRRSILEASATDLLLTEYSFLTKKVRLQTDEWTKHEEKITLPNADIPIPAKKHVDMNSLQNSRFLDLSKFTLKEKFDNVSTVFSMDSSIDTVLITDSLLQSLDETVLKKVAVIRAEFPIMPKWIGVQLATIPFSDKDSPSIIYALGFDWLVYFNSNPPKAIATLIKNEIIDILNSVQPSLSGSENLLQFVFVTVPEIGTYQLRFQEFNMEMHRHIKEISTRFPKMTTEVLDWAQIIKNVEYDKVKTVDRRIRLLFENSLDT